MAIKSYFFNSVDEDRPYDADDWGNWFSALVTNGICGAGDLKVTTKNETGAGYDSAGIVYVAEGSAFIDGHMIVNTDSYELMLEAADASYPRYDMIVARVDHANRLCNLLVRTGTPTTSLSQTPSYPSLYRSDLIYEIGLAAIYVAGGVSHVDASNITDLRADADYCGICGMRFDGAEDVTQFFGDWTQKLNVLYQHLATVDESEDKIAWLQNQLTNLMPSDLTGVATITDWTEESDGSYTQTVPFVLLSESSICYADVDMSNISSQTAAIAALDAWSYVGRIQTVDGGVKFTCYTAKPASSIPFILRMVKYTDLTTGG